jgi:hypothetical protein
MEDVMTMPGDRQLRIVCTDRGTHPSRELAVIHHTRQTRRSPEQLREALDANYGGFSMQGQVAFLYTSDDLIYRVGFRPARRGGALMCGEIIDSTDGRRWRFRCPTCRRDVPMRQERLLRLVRQLIEAGRVSVDLSAVAASLL